MLAHLRPLTSLALVAMALAGCAAVGPDFKTPAAPDVATYSPTGLPGTTERADTLGGASQRFNAGAHLPGSWWTLYRSAPLNQLIEKALAGNPDLDAARASLRVAQEQAMAGDSVLYPSLEGSLGTSRNKKSGPDAGQPLTELSSFSLYNAGISLSYVLDVFGGNRRQIEGLEAAVDVKKHEMNAARATLVANVVTAAIQEASYKAQIAATQDIIRAEKKQLDMLQQQFELGAVAKAAVLAQAATLARTEATLPGLSKKVEEVRNQLRALAGDWPSTPLAASFDLNALHLPEELPVSLPSQLVAQRPDIQAATAQLHAASAAIGVATADMLPKITLSGSYGVDALQMAQLFSPGAALWSLAGGLTQPLFKGGELLHKKRGAEAAYDVAAAQYRKTVLTAFQDVSNALNALDADAKTLKAQLAAERAAAASLDLAREQFQAGAISYLSLLDAEETYEQARIALVQAQAQRYADTAALFLALGGGWWEDGASPGPVPAAAVNPSSSSSRS